MMRSVLSVAVLAMLVVFTPTLEAQPPGGGPGRGGGGRGGAGRGGNEDINLLTLAGIEQVQEEIGLEGDTLAAVRDLQDKVRDESREMMADFGNFREMSREEREAAMEKAREARESVTKDADAELAKLLSDEQNSRLQQIALQVKGPRALQEKEVAAKLGLSEDQTGKIDSIVSSMEDSTQELMEAARSGGRDGFAEVRTKIEALTKETDEKLEAVLTDAQKETFAAMKGDAFELDRRAMFRGRGGNRGEGRGQGRPQRGGDGQGQGQGRNRQRPPIEN
ncbi:hypothetical protein KOR42_30620 [Thalassoglobus neptunius]|uniref:LTXXQ motif protein n=1 Tax=Thalassoglobus neptunius TaxID=1938619 RepID=A0A5C5WN02_9PLAN|nr:hypothetical protein [Thalassoglobus neptunius]TWT52194.1 hypothetical protein KOR42_30620 [Thalassoglobus neptunius]